MSQTSWVGGLLLLLLLLLLSLLLLLLLLLLLFCSLKRRPPHSTRLLGAYICEEADQNLGDFCQDLDRTLAIYGRILHHKMQLRSQKGMPRNYENSSKNKSQNAKIHQNEQK